jgi:N-acyl-D-amino-acid deacylase
MTTLIRSGLVLDGTGTEGRRMDVLVRDGRVAALGIGLDAPEGARVIDADGCWVTPGFIVSLLGTWVTGDVARHG